MEPVLLVGETGTGKTTVCQMAALMRGQRLHILNCNQHTETSDFLGGFRPARRVPHTSCAALLAACWGSLSARLHDDALSPRSSLCAAMAEMHMRNGATASLRPPSLLCATLGAW